MWVGFLNTLLKGDTYVLRIEKDYVILILVGDRL